MKILRVRVGLYRVRVLSKGAADIYTVTEMEDTQITASIIVHEAAFAKEESYFLILQLGETEKVGNIKMDVKRTRSDSCLDPLGCL